jgi:hypothetical protein
LILKYWKFAHAKLDVYGRIESVNFNDNSRARGKRFMDIQICIMEWS